MNIETRWHQLHDAVRAGRVKVAALEDLHAVSLPDMDNQAFSLQVFRDLIADVAKAPRFVIDRSVVDLVWSDQALMSLADMRTCGLLHLPFPFCAVEYSMGDIRFNVHLKEVLDQGVLTWECSLLAYKGKAPFADLVIAFPCQICLEISNPNDDQIDTSVLMPPPPTVVYSVRSEDFVGDRPNVELALEDVHVYAFQRCTIAFIA